MRRAVVFLAACLVLVARVHAERLVVDEDPKGVTRTYQQARALADASRWTDAIQSYQAILQTESAWVKVMPVKFGVYRGVAHVAIEDLLAMPEDAWRAYETRFGSDARGALAAARAGGRVEALEDTALRWPLAAAARESLAAAVELALEKAQPVEAAIAWERFARMWVSRRPAGDAGSVAARLAGKLLEVLAPRGPLSALRRIEQRLALLETVGGPAGGEFAALRRRAAEALANADAADRAPTWWPGLAGDGGAGGVQAPLTDAGACLWTYRFPGTQELFVTSKGPGNPATSSPLHHLACDRDRIYVLDGQAVTAFTRETGFGGPPHAKAWRHFYRLTLDTDATGRNQNAADLGHPGIYAPALDDTSVYALIGGSSQVPTSGRTAVVSKPQLLCLDRATGRRRWLVEPDASSAVEGLAQISLYSLPLPVGERVFVVGADRKDTHSYLLCLDRADGRFLWRTSLPVSLGTQHLKPEHLGRIGAPVLAEAGGAIHVCNQLGSLSVVDGLSGAIRWSASYVERNNAVPLPRGQNSEPKSNPVIVTDELVILHSVTTSRMVAFRRETGEAAWGGVEITGLRHVYGLRNGRVFVSGSFAAAIDAKTGKLLWRTDLRDQGKAGRGALTEDALVCPSGARITALSLENGKPLRTFTWAGRSREVGNLLIAGDLLAIAAPDSLWVFRLGGPRPAVEAGKLTQLTEALGDDESAARERAGRELAALGAAARPALERAVEDPRPEVAWRARALLERIHLTEMLARER